VKRFLALILAGATAGCATTGDIDKLEGQLAALDEIQHRSDQATAAALKHMEQLERDLRAMEYRLQSLKGQIDALQPTRTAPTDIEGIWQKLQNDKSLAPETRTQLIEYLKGLGELTPEKAREEATKLPAQLLLPNLLTVYMREKDGPARTNAWFVLSHWAPSEAAPALEPFLGDGGIRADVIRLFNGMPPVEETRKALLKHANEGADTWKVTIADALGHAGSKDGVRILIGFLYSDESSIRSVAIDGLKAVTGFDLGYKAYAGKDDRKAAAEKWEVWWKENEATFEFPKR